MNAAKTTVGLVRGAQRVYSQKWTFLAVFVLILFVTVQICMATGFIPDATNMAVATPATSDSPPPSMVPLLSF